MPSMVELWCEAGAHTWERKSRRGRKPKNCPDHQGETVALGGDETSVVPDHKPRFSTEDQLLLVKIAQSLRFIHGEDASILGGIVDSLWGDRDQFSRGRFDPVSDERSLRKRLNEVLKPYQAQIDAHRKWLDEHMTTTVTPGWPDDLTLEEAKKKVDPDVRASAILHVQQREANRRS